MSCRRSSRLTHWWTRFPGRACNAGVTSDIAPWRGKGTGRECLWGTVVEMGMNRHTEQEWQFAASELGPARNWLAAQTQDPTERRCAPQPTLNVQDTYYDSPDWMIFRAGFALRVRRSREADVDIAAGDAAGNAEITLKSLRHAPQNGSNDGLARRTEFSEPMG